MKNQIITLFTSDWHLDKDPKRKRKACESLDQMVDYVKNNQVDYIVHGGDFWETRQNFGENSGVEYGFEYLQELAKHVKAVIINKGNNNHDYPQSISLLARLGENIFAYEYPIALALYPDNGKIIGVDVLRDEDEIIGGPEFIVNLMPYPTKAMIVRNMSIDDNNKEFGEVFDGLMDMFGITNEKFKCPKAFSFHGNVRGSRLSTGQPLPGQDIIISPLSLRKAKADVYAFGHIHNWQEFAPDMFYTGPLYNCNFGETEQKYFIISKFDQTDGGVKVSSEKIKFKTVRPMVNVTAEFINGEFVIDEQEMPENPEVKFKYKINEDEQSLVTEAKKDEIRARYGADVIIASPDVIPVQRESRSEKIMEAENLAEEFTEFCIVTGRDEVFKPSNDGKEKILKTGYRKKLELIEQNIPPDGKEEEL